MAHAIALSGITAIVHFRYGETTQFYIRGNNFGTITAVTIGADGVNWHVDFDPDTDIITPGMLIRVRTIPKPGLVVDDKNPFRSADLTITLTNREGIPIPVAMVLGELVQD